MDVIFDIDCTLANPAHRLHFIKDMAYWTCTEGKPPKPDWASFMHIDQVSKDTAIVPAWEILYSLLCTSNRVIFITGRSEDQRQMTYDWLTDLSCEYRSLAIWEMQRLNSMPTIYMRKSGDRRPSHIVKEEGLMAARADGFNPTLVFEDRADDTAMWRRNGLFCCQVAVGNY